MIYTDSSVTDSASKIATHNAGLVWKVAAALSDHVTNTAGTTMRRGARTANDGEARAEMEYGGKTRSSYLIKQRVNFPALTSSPRTIHPALILDVHERRCVARHYRTARTDDSDLNAAGVLFGLGKSAMKRERWGRIACNNCTVLVCG